VKKKTTAPDIKLPFSPSYFLSQNTQPYSTF